MAFDYIIANRGIDSEAYYPYTGIDGGICNFKPENISATIKEYYVRISLYFYYFYCFYYE